MSKVKLIEVIEELQRIRDEYKKEFKKEPQMWGCDSFGSEIESIEICHSYRKGKVGHTASDVKEYRLWD